MKLRNKTAGETKLHSRNATFCGVDVQPSELYSQSALDDGLISYTGVIISQPEYFTDFVQWKDTESLEQRLDILNSINAFVSNDDSRSVLCFSVFTSTLNGWNLGSEILADTIERNQGDIETTKTQSGRYFRFEGKKFKEARTVSMAAYAFMLATIFQHIAREISKSSSLESLQKPILQFLLDNVAGDGSSAGNRLNQELILYLVENSPLNDIIKSGLRKSCFSRFGIAVAESNKILDEDEVFGTNEIPLMIATDWFSKICSRYHEIARHQEKMDKDDALILEIFDQMRLRKCLVWSRIPDIFRDESSP